MALSLARAPLLCAAFFAIAPLLCALVENEIDITVYIHQAFSGPTKNQAKVVQGFNNTRFGETHVFDWPVSEGPDPSAKVIGRAQGLLMMSSQKGTPGWCYTSMNLLFSDESRFSGSTLQIIGHSSIRESSIVGGTGEFTMARGVIKYTKVKSKSGSNLFKVNVHAYYSSMDSTVVSAVN